MVRPEGLEPPACWFEARNRRIIYDLAPGTAVVRRYSLLPVFEQFDSEPARALATVRTTSMQGVGTKTGHSRIRKID